MFGKSRSLMAMAVLGASLGAGMPAMGYQPPRITANASKSRRKAMFSGQFYMWGVLMGTKGAGICMAQQKRAAKKVRNVKRHNAAGRKS